MNHITTYRDLYNHRQTGRPVGSVMEAWNALDRELAVAHCNGSRYTQRDTGISIEWCVCECVYVCVWGLLNCISIERENTIIYIVHEFILVFRPLLNGIYARECVVCVCVCVCV